MNWLCNPNKKIHNILIKIGKGRVSEAEASLKELLGKDPSITIEVIDVLVDILKGEDTKMHTSAITVLNTMAEMEPELVANSLDVIIGCIRRGEKEYREDWILGSFDILFKISQKYPEKMSFVISDLIRCLENISASVREKSYLLLVFLKFQQPGIFSGHSKELIRALNGLYIDERIYACRLIKKIAEMDPKIVESTYDVLEDLRLNHPDSNLRSEAAFAVEKLKVKENIIKQKPSGLVEANKAHSEKRKKIEASYLTKDMSEASNIPFSEPATEYAVEKLKVKENIIKQKPSVLVEANKARSEKRKKIKASHLTKDMSEASNIPFSELANLYEKELRDILDGWGVNHLIRKK